MHIKTNLPKLLLAGLACWLLWSCELPQTSPVAASTTDVEASASGVSTDKMGFQNGDLIFQTSMSSQSKAIQLATNSRYSHVGLLYQQNDGNWCVYEAVATVRCTDLTTWIARGRDQHYVVKRLRNAAQHLTPDRLRAMRKAGERHVGTPYDIQFKWDNERYYCSELVWKLYHDATGIELAPLVTLKDMALNNPVVQKKLKERYGNVIPMEETVIAPSALFNSQHLVTVFQY